METIPDRSAQALDALIAEVPAGALTDPEQRRDLAADQARRLGGRLDAWTRYIALTSVPERQGDASVE